MTLLLQYVDDIILSGSNEDTTNALKLHFHNTFSIKGLGALHFFVSIEINKSSDGVLTQRKFTKELLSECVLDVSKPVIIHFP